MKMNKKIYAFAGRKRSGKSVLSNVIKEETKYSVIITIANYLKYLCCDILGIDYDTLNERKDNGYTFNIIPDDKWFNIINKKTNLDIDIIKKEIGSITFTNIRQMLQIIGTDLIRKYEPNWHVNCMINDINSFNDETVIIIDDVRFPNEKEAIENIGGEVFFIVRPNYFDVSNHISEISLEWQDFDDYHIIINDLTLDDFKNYFKISYNTNFDKNLDTPLFLAKNQHFKYYNNINYPYNSSCKTLLDDILKQNVKDVRFLHNGIIHYKAANREKANDFCNEILNSDCQNWKRDFIIYNPLINENLKQFL